MQFEVLFLLLFGFCNSAPSGGLPLISPGGIGGIFKGPNSETIIRGPDGSEITSEQKGGAVVQEDILAAQPIVVAEPSIPVVTSNQQLISISSTPASLLQSVEPSTLLTGEVAPVVPIQAPIEVKPVEIVQQDPHVIETEIIAAPDVEPDQSSDLTGPSGRIITKGSASIVSGPASTTITEPRKIIVAPPKILLEAPLVVPQPISASTLSPISEVVVSTTASPLGLENWVGGSSTVDSSRIDLGVQGSAGLSIPLVEHSSSNGVLNEQAGLLSSTSIPLISSTLSNIVSLGELSGVGLPATHLVPPAAPLVSSTLSPNIQKITSLQDTIPDGRVDMGYKPRPYEYKLPEVLSSALSRFYSKPLTKPRDSLVIDDKMGELTQNEITSDIRSSINLEQIPWSQVSKISGDGSYHQSGLTGGWGRK